jgi:hypothetical protein
MCYRTETVKYNFDTLFVCYTLYIFMSPCIFGKILNFLESVYYALSENVYFPTPQLYTIRDSEVYMENGVSSM